MVESAEIKEWHFHVYFKQTVPASVAAANAFRELVVASVAAGDFIVVCDGVELPELPKASYAVNMKPVGPHPVGSYEIWVPAEHVSAMLSFTILNRGELSIYVHPLTRYELLDHTTRAFFLGPSYPVETFMLEEDMGSPPLQYPELQLGYSAPQ